ncbi:MAG: hypothetical protein NC300_10670 [Bacteroidales bacterium]|nr:hypothetical protein [Clostridium sp.]MCM1204594.1 hypothetical protein [Bacteroidales bacterium]
MANDHNKMVFRMLFLITTPKLENKAVDLFRERNIPVQYHFRAQGTASSEIMNTLGLDGGEKSILMCMLPKGFADEMLVKLHRKLYLGMPNSGIAFTVMMSGCSGRMIKLMENLQPENGKIVLERDEVEMMESEYSMIMTIANRGFSEEIMDEARPMGASGGTVFHSRRVGSEEAMKFWGISVQQEREIVLIIAKKEDKRQIMQAIGKKFGMQSEANGIVLSLPVDGITGLNG